MTCQLHSLIFFATAINLPFINLIALTLYYTCQPCHYYKHGISRSNRLKTKVAMMSVDQTDKAYKSNVIRDLGNV